MHVGCPSLALVYARRPAVEIDFAGKIPGHETQRKTQNSTDTPKKHRPHGGRYRPTTIFVTINLFQ